MNVSPAIVWSATIEVRAPGQQVISLAVTRFLPMSGSRSNLAQEFHTVLTGDLEMTVDIGSHTHIMALILGTGEGYGLARLGIDDASRNLLGRGRKREE